MAIKISGSTIIDDARNIVNAGVITATDAVITGNLTVQGDTTILDTTVTEVDKLEVFSNNTTVGIALTQSGVGDALTIDDGTSRSLTVADGGNIGIGSITPRSKLDIILSSDSFITVAEPGKSLLQLNANYSSAPILNLDHTGSSPFVIMRKNNDGILGILNNGNIGIGTTNPTYQIDVQGTGNIARIGDVSNFDYIDLNFDDVGYPAIQQPSSNDYLELRSLGSAQISIDSNDNQTNANFKIKTNGKAGSGTTVFLINEVGDFRVFQSNSAWTNSTYHPILQWDFKSGPGNMMYMASGGNTSIANQMAIVISDTHGFKVGRSGWDGISDTDVDSNNEYFRITNSGNVGIGTDNPSYQLHVYSSGADAISTIDSDSGDADLQLRNSGNGNWSGINFIRERSTGTNVTGGSIWMPSNTANASALLYIQTQTASANAGVDGPLTDNNGVRLKLATQPNGIGANSAFSVEVGSSERFKVGADGHVGIGISIPDSKFHVVEGNLNGTDDFTAHITDFSNDGISGGLLIDSFQPRFVISDLSTSQKFFDWRVNNSVYILSSGTNTDYSARDIDNILRITNTGIVGINTVHSGNRLRVHDSSTSITTPSLYVVDNKSMGAYENNYTFGLARHDQTGVSALYLGIYGRNDALIASNNSTLRLGYDVSGTFNEQVTINSSGVGIGDTTLLSTNTTSWVLSVGGPINMKNNALISNDGGSSNIDHLWHTDTGAGGAGGVWHFVSDGTYKANGSSRVHAGHFYAGESGQTTELLGGLTVSGTKSFKIDHPLENKKDTHYLIHAAVESPKADLIYRGKSILSFGTTSINIDEYFGMTNGTFVALTRDVQCFTTNESNWDLVKGSVSENIVTIYSQNQESSAEVSWIVIAERNDDAYINRPWTNENGGLILELEKEPVGIGTTTDSIENI